MHISAEHYGALKPITGLFKNAEMERLYKRYTALRYRQHLIRGFVILAVLNTIMLGVDMYVIPVSEGWGLFALRGIAYVVLAVVGKLLLTKGFSCWYCRSIFGVAVLMATITIYRYDVLYHMGHEGFDFGVQVSALILLYTLCAILIMLPVMAYYVLITLTATAMVVHTFVHEPDGFVVHRVSWVVYILSTAVMTTFATWFRRGRRFEFYQLQIKPKAYARAMGKNTVLEKIKNAFMANATAQVLAHELKSPLATAYGYAQMNNDTHTQKALEKMNAIIQNIDYLGKGKIKKKAVSVCKILESTSDLWFNVAENTQGQVHITDTLNPKDKAIVCVDDVLLQGGIANVVRNGLQVRPNGAVTITITGTDTHIGIRISNDTPCPAYLNDNVFMPMWDQEAWEQHPAEDDIFGHTKPKVHKKSESIGVGLAFVYDTITRMGGRIYIDYQVSNSTDFVIEIPRDLESNG